jgi:aspartate-semialdehyde dehydrogenase
VTGAFGEFRGEVAGRGLHTAPEEPLHLFTEEARPQPALDALLGSAEGLPGMTVGVGQVRVSDDGRIRFFVLSHNTIRGSAGGSVLNAELALAEGILQR